MNSNTMTDAAEFTSFFEGFQRRIDVIRDYQQKLNRFVAQDFNLIDFLRPDEYRISELIAFLLDPVERHGQGAIFLQAFLAQLASVPAATMLQSRLADGGKVTVHLEEPTRARRRIDILVSISPEVVIGIENKPWAVDQPAQLAHYAEDLKNRYRSWALIYVRGDGGEPGEGTLPEERRRELLSQGCYAEWSYPVDFANWVTTCAKICEADKLRWLLRDFHSYVLSSFSLTGQENAGNVG
jgi:hypothetical protein